MNNFKIASDSACDLPKELVDKIDIDILPYYVSFDSEKYFRDGVDISNAEFYDKIVNEKIFPKTSFPAIQEYVDLFTSILSTGQDLIFFSLTSKFSGGYQASINARNMVLENFPDRKIEVIDSKNATLGQGLVVLEACYMKQAGLSFETISEKIRLLIEEAKLIVTVDTLEYLQRGGRVGKASALAGTILNIKPLIMLRDGELFPISKSRGRKKR